MKKKTNEEINNIDLNEARDYLVDIVPKVWVEVLEEYYERGVFSVRDKEGVDYAIDADDRADEYLRDHISERFPNTQFLTEETAQKDYLKLKNAENLWIIDALDGSTNFSKKRPHFGISVALVSKGIPRIGVVYLPIQDELYLATESSEVFLNGKEIHVSKTGDMRKAWVESGISWDMDKRVEFARDWIPEIVKNVRAFTMSGSSVFDMARVAKGQVDAFVYCGIKPWDQAATGLIIQKAGGVITTADGKPWNVFERDIIASNGLLHNQILEMIAKKD